MLYDRHYMRDSGRRSPLSAVGWVLVVIVGVFLLQILSQRLFNYNPRGYSQEDPLSAFARLDGYAIRHWHVWTYLTYAVLHGGILHLLLNSVGLFFIGRTVETVLGSRRFLIALGVSILGGSILWTLVNFNQWGAVVGISGGVMGLFTIFACLYPDRPITLLVFYVIPLTIKPRWALIIFGGIDLVGLLASELPRHGAGLYSDGIAHSAHVGGIIAGWLYYRFFLRERDETLTRQPAIEKPGWFKRAAATGTTTTYRVNLSTRSAPPPAAAAQATAATERDLRAEVDRILDKINSEGFGALTTEEKRTLDEARDLISRR
ncbi:putative membrane protein [Opitutaceae bacterium TAV1]|nr:protease [Opitutaceae bacterium TAV5]EIQ00684.1 putative membrane protein [Opitutaceae bacterium TAV1]